MTKICKACKLEKILEKDFYSYIHANGSRYYKARCNKCIDIQRQEAFERKSVEEQQIIIEKRKADKVIYYQTNKEEIRLQQNEYNSINKNELNQKRRDRYPEIKKSYRKYNLKIHFNLTIEQYDKMLEEQNHVCAICFKPEEVRRKFRDDVRNLAVDHCHTTGKVRGLLCAKCNSALGLLKDSSDILNNAITYLNKNQIQLKLVK